MRIQMCCRTDGREGQGWALELGADRANVSDSTGRLVGSWARAAVRHRLVPTNGNAGEESAARFEIRWDNTTREFEVAPGELNAIRRYLAEESAPVKAPESAPAPAPSTAPAMTGAPGAAATAAPSHGRPFFDNSVGGLPELGSERPPSPRRRLAKKYVLAGFFWLVLVCPQEIYRLSRIEAGDASRPWIPTAVCYRSMGYWPTVSLMVGIGVWNIAFGAIRLSRD